MVFLLWVCGKIMTVITGPDCIMWPHSLQLVNLNSWQFIPCPHRQAMGFLLYVRKFRPCYNGATLYYEATVLQLKIYLWVWPRLALAGSSVRAESSSWQQHEAYLSLVPVAAAEAAVSAAAVLLAADGRRGWRLATLKWTQVPKQTLIMIHVSKALC